MQGQHNTLSTRDVQGMFYDELRLAYGRTWLPKICFGPVNSDQAQETYGWLGMPPPLARSRGAMNLSGQREGSVTIANEDYDGGLEIDPRFWRRDKTGQLAMRIKQMAGRAVAHWPKLVYDLINSGTATTCHDGQYFYDNDHSEGDSGTQINLITSTQVSQLNVTTPTAPTPAEAANALINVIAYMMGYLDDQGEPVNEEARKFVVITPVNLYAPFKAAVSKELLLASSGASTGNPLPIDEFEIEVAMMARLGSGSAVFYPFIADRNSKPFILQEESIAPEEPFVVWGPGSDYAREHGKCAAHYKVSRGSGYGHWWLASHCTLV